LRSEPRIPEFIELPLFGQTAEGLLDDDDLRTLQHVLSQNPRAGVVVPGTGGIRKVRIAASGRGKRGGARVLYLYVEIRSRIYLLAAVWKSKQGDITREGYRVLARLAKELNAEG
jgi:hypothetical protein